GVATRTRQSIERADEPIGGHARGTPLGREPAVDRYVDCMSGTAEITTTACAIGPSSVMVASMRALQPDRVMALRHPSAPPVGGRAHGLHCTGKPAGHGLTDQKVADVEFDDLGQCGDRLGGGEIETVASMNFEPEAPRQLGAMADALPFGLYGRHPVVGKG